MIIEPGAQALRENASGGTVPSPREHGGSDAVIEDGHQHFLTPGAIGALEDQRVRSGRARRVVMRKALLFAAMVGGLVATLALAQDKPADDMQILLDKLRADKKLVVAEAMELTESEAKGFWPVYDGYQKDLGGLGDRTIALIKDYAANYQSMSDQAAKRLVDDYLAIEQDRVKLLQSYLPRFRKALPERKVARYYQIENKIRAAVNWTIASEIPMVK
jgi:hypothetical protein